jgi:MoxR-like ATPase
MREGSVLFINEMNRMPETVQNVLLPALDERLIVLPRLGELSARPGFQVVATQNPVEYIATGHLSEALRDRFEHVSLRYQGEIEERAIVTRDTGAADAELVALAVAIVRMTRTHEKIRKGASVRAAAGIVKLALALAAGGDPTDDAVLREAAVTALATRIELKDEEETDLASVVAQIIDSVKKKT